MYSDICVCVSVCRMCTYFGFLFVSGGKEKGGKAKGKDGSGKGGKKGKKKGGKDDSLPKILPVSSLSSPSSIF